MNSFHMSVETTFLIETISTLIARKWSFSSVSQNMNFNLARVAQNLGALWTSSPIHILQLWRKKDQFYFISKLWTVFKCLRRLLFRLKALTHKLHPKGCSPVWLKMCCLTRDGALISLEQNGQAHRCSPSRIGSFCNFNQ